MEPLRVFYLPEDGTMWDIVHPKFGRGYYSGQSLEEVRREQPTAEIGEYKLVLAMRDDHFRKPPAEITEDEFYENLGVLPPYGHCVTTESESFKVSELISGNIAAIFARVGARFFRLQDDMNMPHQDIIDACKQL